jgi:hypothetical protein
MLDAWGRGLKLDWLFPVPGILHPASISTNYSSFCLFFAH